jgi:hypothetical protein
VSKSLCRREWGIGGFGYTNDSRLEVKKPIRYTTIARPGADPIEQAA